MPVRFNPRRSLALVLAGLGCLDLCALLAVVAPRAMLEAGHRLTGMGDLPPEPIVAYLARSGSALYALHGAMILFISRDVERYWPLIRFLALAALVHGAVMFGIDVAEGMPRWWQLAEGPAFAATGGIVLWLQNRVERETNRSIAN